MDFFFSPLNETKNFERNQFKISKFLPDRVKDYVLFFFL